MTTTAILRHASAGLSLATLLVGCAGIVTDSGSASPPQTSQRAPVPGSRPVDGAQAQRLQRTMVPLIRVMNNPLPLNRVKVGIIDDSGINAASGGGGEFYVTSSWRACWPTRSPTTISATSPRPRRSGPDWASA
jgi:hypothetical protein